MTTPTAAELLELMSVLAHDLRAPLTPIRGYAEIVRTRPELGQDKTQEYAGIVVEAAARMEHSVDMLSGISALYGGRGQVREEPYATADIVAERLDIWRGRLPDRTFAGHTGAAPAGVLIDRGWLGKALDVLIEQATKAWPAPAVISVRAATGASGDSVHLVIGPLAEEATEQGPPLRADRLGRAFVEAVCSACGYEFVGDFEVSVPAGVPS